MFGCLDWSVALFAYLGFLLLSAIFLTSALGYGRLACQILGSDDRIGFPYEITLGISTLALLGAIVSAIGQARGWAVDIVFGFGTMLLIVQIGRDLRVSDSRVGALTAPLKGAADPVVWLAGVLFVLSSVSIVPTTTLNPGDDFRQYLLRPIHMMQTGTLGANWFDNTGLDGLGSTAWMQAFFLNHLPLTYGDAFDDVICLPLCCLMIGSVGTLVGASRARIIMAAIAMVCINPVQVNTSAKYSLTLMLLGGVVTILLFAQRYFVERARRSVWIPPLCAVALFSITAVSFKATAAPFVAVLFGALAAAILFMRVRQTDLLAATLAVALSSITTAVVYAASFVHEYIAILTTPRFPEPIVTGLFRLSIYESLHQWGLKVLGSVFQVTGYQYNQWPINTTLGFFIVLILAIVAANRISSGDIRSGGFSSAFAMMVIGPAAVGSYALLMVVTPWGFIRYSAPMLTAVLPIAFLIGFPQNVDQVGIKLGTSPIKISLVFPVCGLVILLNIPSVAERIQLARNYHTASIFGGSSIADVVRKSLSEDRKTVIHSLQGKLPSDRKILAAILEPFFLDFGRNPGYSMSLSGLGNPWIGALGNMSPQQLSAYLSSLGIEYLIWQRQGPHVISKEWLQTFSKEHTDIGFLATQAQNFLAFCKAVDALELGPMVYSDATYIIFKLDPAFNPTLTSTSYDLGTKLDFTTRGHNCRP
jgi:hypothetical protein